MHQRLFSISRVTRALAVLPIVAIAGCGSPEQSAQKYYESGMALIEKKDDLGARLELLKAVKYKSDKVEVWRALAGIDERTKASSLFLDLRRIVELDPNDLDARLQPCPDDGSRRGCRGRAQSARGCQGRKAECFTSFAEGDRSAADQRQCRRDPRSANEPLTLILAT